jgi:Zn-finger nucleic acid-binding protein
MLDWKVARPLFQSLSLEVRDLHELVQQAQRRPRPGPDLACTACGKGPLKAFRVQGIELDLCEACGAVWFDRDELARVTAGKAGTSLQPAPLGPDESSEVVGVYEMLWDCAYCQTRGLKGAANRFCPQCGAQQDATRRYFPAEGQEVAANLSFEGADRLCPACATPNGSRANNCRSCGSPLDGSQEAARVADRSPQAPVPGVAASPGRGKWPVVIGALVLVTCGLGGAALLWKRPVEVTVVGHSWKREIDIEQLRATPDQAWCSSLPAEAYAVSRSREQRSTRKVPDGQDCSTRDVDRGNGTFERRRECRPRYRDEPVYDERCHFLVQRWQRDRTLTATGEGLEPPPRWPEPEVRLRGTSLGAEREGPRRETYRLELRSAASKTYACTVRPDRWAALEDGATRPVKVGVVTGSADCDAL